MFNSLTSHVRGSIDEHEVGELDLLRYEAERSRCALLLLKTKLGPERLSELLRPETARSTALYARWNSMSGGRFVTCTADLSVTGGSAAGFLSWFGRVSKASEEVSLLGANPEHYLVQDADGAQEVIETLGAWGEPVHLHISFEEEVTDLLGTDVLDSAYPMRMTGVGRVGGDVGGAVVHQFADTSDGFNAKLAIYFPEMSDPAMVSGHRTHLVLEFTNWINMYLAEEGLRPEG